MPKPKQPKAYTHDGATRVNIPESGAVDIVPKDSGGKKEYCWDPRLSPQLVWAGKAGLTKVEAEEQASLEVPNASLHIHERVSTEAILRSVRREDAQRSLFADPELDFTKEIQFYQHDVDWSNRMILGDSLLVMNSLLEREGMRGSVQCIYMDPPYGIKYASNFQPRIDQRDVKDGKDDDLTREVMQVQAFRDTWELEVHSYLTYLRDRLLLARELLKESGSIFVQIGDENVHRVRCLMDEVFGEENFVGQIAFNKTTGAGSPAIGTLVIASVCDYVLWFAKDQARIKYRQTYELKDDDFDPGGKYGNVLLPDGQVQRLTSENQLSGRVFRLDNFTSQASPPVPFEYQGKRYIGGWKTNEAGMKRLASAGRVSPSSNSLNYVRFIDDFPAAPINNAWMDVGGIQSRLDPKVYAVQTATKVVARCILMTTDPGDLVLDPTCGSGTTAYVAEQWGRRWITMDTSRVALAIARHRLMTAAFDYYKLRHPPGGRASVRAAHDSDQSGSDGASPSQAVTGVSGGFVYKTVPHVTLKSIAQNHEIDAIAAEYQPQIAQALADVNQAFGKDWKEWEVPRGGEGTDASL